MPTRAERPSSMLFVQDTQRSWTDDLPVCKQSGVGFSTNQIYREDGCRQEEHPFEDRSFHCKYDDSTFLYAVFDGHEGFKTANFAMQRMAAEILLGQLNGKTTDEEVKEVLRQAFISVERGYTDSIGDLLAERASLQFDIPDGLNSYEAYQKFPEVFKIQSTLTGVAQAVVDKIVRIHHDVNMSSSSSSTNGKRDDITLLVRNFNFPLPNALKSPTAPSVHFSPLVQCVAESNCENSCADDKEDAEGSSTAEETSTETYDGPRTVENKNARIRPYVDFSEYYANVEKRKKDGTLPDGIQF